MESRLRATPSFWTMDWPDIYRRKIRYSDSDAQGIVFNGNYLSYYDDTLTDVFELIGLTESVMHGDGYDVLTVHAEVDFSATARLGETLSFSAGVERIGTTSITFDLESSVAGTDRVTTRGKVVFVVVDHQTHEPVPVPDRVRDLLDRR